MCLVSGAAGRASGNDRGMCTTGWQYCCSLLSLLAAISNVHRAVILMPFWGRILIVMIG